MCKSIYWLFSYLGVMTLSSSFIMGFRHDPEAPSQNFLFNVLIDYLPEDDEVAVVSQTTSSRPAPLQPLFSGEDVVRFHEIDPG